METDFTAKEDDLSSMSQTELAELTTDHGLGDVEEEQGPRSRALRARIGTHTDLGEAIVEIAKSLRDKPLTEDAGSNQDSGGLIRKFFIEGAAGGWAKKPYWDDWIKLHPDSPVPKPEWCAAFASYCVRKGYEQLGLKLPIGLSASTSGLRDLFSAAGRFLTRDQVFDEKGKVKDVDVLPGPGDIVLWQGHTGLLFDLFDDGSYQTIEGNTRPKKGMPQGVYLLSNDPTRKREKDGKLVYTLTGFCLLASRDG